MTLAVDSVERVGEAIRSVLGIFRDSSYFEQRVYDLDALMMTVRGLHQIAPEHPLGLKTLRSPVEKAQETDDILSFYYGLAALDELHQPLNPYLTTTVIPSLLALTAKKRLTGWQPIPCCGTVAAIFPPKRLQTFSNSLLS